VALETYRKKRQFGVTPEPRGRKGPAGGYRYVIQKHAARRLHYDLRLELDGVMKSWAVTRGPSLDPGEKRLAVQVEDHPVEYNSFEGTIPEGEYGGGTVMIWDRGTWSPEGDAHKALAKGHLIFDLDGERLHGRWHLVRMRERQGDRHDNWLLIKGKDGDARGPHDRDILEEQSRSVASGRSIEEIAGGKGKTRVWHSNRSEDGKNRSEDGKAKTKVTATTKNKVEDRASFKQKIRQIATDAKARVRAKPKAAETKAAKTKAAQTKAAKTKAAKPKAVTTKAAKTDAAVKVSGGKRRTRSGERTPGGKDETSKNKKTARSAKGKPPPDFVPLSLATFYDTAPSGPDWLHEIKFDGYRTEARLEDGKSRLLTRKQQNWTHRFPPVAAAVAALPVANAVLDGEIVVEDEKGISSFSLLQTDLKDGRTDRFVYYVFDLLYLDGRDLTGVPLVERKAALGRLLAGLGKNGIIRYTEDTGEAGPVILRHACEMGLEGIISKRRAAPYRSGRTDNFIKTKCRGEQEFVVAGYAPATAMPRAIGALIVAVYEGGELRYAGRVGTGYTQKMAHDLFKRLSPLRVDKRPVALPPDERRKDVVWVEPKLVIEAEFAGITHGGVLRQASFKGIREDKAPKDVVREVPAPAGNARSEAMSRNTVQGKESAARAVGARASPGAVDRTSTPGGAGAKNKKATNGVALRLTHPDRVYWPDVGVTKADLAAYYVSVWDWIKPHILGRALSLVRAPEGVGGETFFQKHIAANVKSSPLRHTVAGKDGDVIAVETVDDLVAIVQSGTLEIHVRGSRLDSLETCDRIVFDLDPGEDVAWQNIVAAAREIRDRLAAENLESFVKLSGGKGIHVVLPIADTDWETAKTFSGRVAARMAADSPKLYLAKMTKALRKGRIFIDYFRNSREATSIAPYSTRARAGAPVSTPLAWERLPRTEGGNEFSVLDLKTRIKDDAWAEIGKVQQKLPGQRKS
jgi:bifunctional non-homologous end joining protein LigD